MRSVFFTASVLGTLFCFAGLALGQVGTGGIFADPQGTITYRHDTTPGRISFQPNQGVGRIGVFSDTQGTNCNITQSAPFTLFQVYLVHIEATGVTASQFIAPKPPCLNAIWLNDSDVFPVVVGTTQTSKSIGYGSCKSGNFLICTMNFLSQGASPNCCAYDVLPDPLLPSGQYEFSDCDFVVHNGGGKAGVVNANADCPCGRVCDQPNLTLQGYQTVSRQDPLWTVQVEVRNWGPGPARNVSATMQQDIPWLYIPDAACYYGEILRDESSLGGE